MEKISLTALERTVCAALETYSNVHRGSGHNSVVSTLLYEQAREAILEYLGFDKRSYAVIFCTPRRAERLKALLGPGDYRCVSSSETGLPFGLRAVAVRRKALPRGTPFQSGGGTTKIVSPDWVVWADPPDRFEAGTPSIINVIAFARALQLMRKYGEKKLVEPSANVLSAGEILYRDDLEGYSGHELLERLRQTMTGRNVMVPTSEGARRFINLDNSASTPAFRQAWEAARLTWRQPEDVQKDIAREVRAICAEFLGAPPADYDVVFTVNTTEAINLAAENVSRSISSKADTVIVSTLLEHTSNDLPWRSISRNPLIRLSIDADGFFNLHQLASLMSEYNEKGLHGSKRISLVAVSGASNVLGVFNDLAEISRIVHRYGARLLVDGAQLVAHRAVGIRECAIDYFAFSAHKTYAPFGCGVLIAKKELLGFTASEMDLIRASGDENAAGIAALGKALVLLKRAGMDLILEEEQALTARALKGMTQIDGIKIHGIKDPDSPRFAQKGGVIAFELKGSFSDRVAKALAGRGGIGIRYGCHCAHILVKHLVGLPHSLERLQRLIALFFPRIGFPGLARISLGIGNSREDIDVFLQVMNEIAVKFKARGTAARMDRQQMIDDYARETAEKIFAT